MKKIEAIIRPEKFDEVRQELEKAGYPGLMVTEIEGHGKQKGITQQWRGEEYKVDLVPKLKLEIVVADREVDKILQAITATAKTGKVGDGKIFVSSVDSAVRIRTGEKGDQAI